MINSAIKRLVTLLNTSSPNSPLIKATSNDLIANLKELSDFNIDTISDLLDLIDHPKVAIELAIVSGNTVAKIASKCIKEDSLASWLQSILGQYPKDFTQLCVVTGCLNYLGPQENSFLVADTLSIVLKSCQQPTNHSYQSFQALKLWSLKAKQAGQANFLKEERPQDLQLLCDVINANWENPLRGVPDLMADSLSSILDLVNCRELDKALWNQMAALSWKTKAKYPLMLVLLPRMGVFHVLESESDFAAHLVESLSSNHLTSAGTSVYRLIIRTPEIYDIWKAHVMPHVIHALVHDSRPLVRANCKHHWLNPTIKAMPAAADLLYTELSSLAISDQSDIAKCLVIKCIRLKSSQDLSEDQRLALNRCLIHSNDEVRSAAFSALCHVKKKSSVPSRAEMKMIQDFIQLNLAVDSAAFRQELISDFTTWLVRLRDCSVALFRKKAENAVWRPLVECVNEILLCLFANLFPGANYQRLISSLELLRVLHQCFFNYQPCVGINKASKSDISDPLALVRHVQSCCHLMEFYQKAHMEKLLLATLHYMIDVKSLASEILAFFPPDQTAIRTVLKKALLLACSCKFSECETAALLFGLCLKWSSSHGDHPVDWPPLLLSTDITENPLLGEAMARSLSETDLSTQLSPLLLHIYGQLFSKGQQQSVGFLLLAKSAPMHGLLMSLRTCLKLELEELKANKAIQAFDLKLINELEKSVHFMLDILGRPNASFADMGQAVERVINVQEENCQERNMEVNISEEFSLVLACAWLNIKEASLLAAELGFHSSDEVAQRAGQLLIRVLTGTRHKGVMEAAAPALSDLCRHLLTTSGKSSSFPEKWLKDVIDDSFEGHTASVTRRSAGLPLLVRSLVSSEARGTSGGRHLLTLAVSQLLSILEEETNHSISETEDVPHAHALHVLRSLIHDSSLSHDVQPHLPGILRQCVQHFHSPLWSVRNAALQLFGGLMPRIMGQKKLRSADEDSFYNSITATELFARHISLAPILIQNLQRAELINPSLVPILSMLSRVAPGLAKDDDAAKDLKQHLITFQWLFVKYLSHAQYMVRQLAAKSLISFTPQSEMVSTLKMLVRLWQANKSTKNFEHGILMALYLGTKLLKMEYPDQFKEYQSTIQESMDDQGNTPIQTEVPMNLLLRQKWTKLLDLKECRDEIIAKIEADYHPGAKDYLIHNQQGFRTDLDHCKIFLTQLTNYSVQDILEFVEETSLGRKEICTGAMMEDISQHCQKQRDAIYQDGELALELLHISTHRKIVKEQRYGKSAAASFVSLSAMAFSAMLHQDDFSMFFGQDGSTYVSLFCDTAETALLMAQPHHQEIERAYAADFILNLVPVFLNRILNKDCGQLTVHMHYGLVQVLNISLLLLNDEDNEIRRKAVDFASQLSGQKLCVTKAIQSLTMIGLQCFEECAEYFQPVLQLSHLQWTFAINQETCHTASSTLFENGDGINVYCEEAFNAGLYAQTLLEWLETLDRSPKFRLLNCNPGQVAEVKSTFLKQFSLFAAPWSTPKGYNQAIQIYYFLKAVNQYPCLLDNDMHDMKEVKETCDILASKLLVQ